jgi:response regulator RpfG family c-di-GMP phosphodiesterase
MEEPTSQKDNIPSPKILIVDDRIENLVALEKTLADLDTEIIRATSGEEALAALLNNTVALILLDVQMPDMDGFETASLIRSNEDTQHIPIIFVTAISKDRKHVFSGYASGAVDYLFKPLDPAILKSKVGVFLELDRHKAAIARTNEKLKAANRKILEQQKSVVKEERLKVLLQMAGATAHELNQPLMSLLGNIDLIRMTQDDPSKWMSRLGNIEVAAQRMADIVRRIQTIGNDDVKPYPGGLSIINIDQTIDLLFAGDSDADFSMLQNLMQDQGQIRLTRAKSIAEGIQLAQMAQVNIVVLGDSFADGNDLDFLAGMDAAEVKKPILAVTGHGDETVAARIVQHGVYDFLPKFGLKQTLFLKSIATAIEKFRLSRAEPHSASRS